MDKKLSKKCEKLHKQNQFGEIIKRLEAEPQTDYEVVGHLARAYNNKGRFQDAIALLLSAKEKGESDPLWHFRLGYAYDHLGQHQEALAAFEKVLALNPKDWEARLYIRKCRKNIKAQKAKPQNQTEAAEETAFSAQEKSAAEKE
mgnify:CR=1 FL=1